MKIQTILPLAVMLTTFHAYGQGTLIYDQSSATNPLAGGAGAPIRADQPMGQSFTPTLSSIGFAQLNFFDNPGNVGATVYVNLWSGSISNGTLLSSTDPIYIPPGIVDFVTNFLFSTAVTLTPGTTYYIQPYLQSGDVLMGVNVGIFNYSGGTFYANGAPNPNNQDLWFREGVMEVPEPSSSLLILLGSGLLLYARHKHKSTSTLKSLECVRSGYQNGHQRS
jgi:hypothetical protein